MPGSQMELDPFPCIHPQQPCAGGIQHRPLKLRCCQQHPEGLSFSGAQALGGIQMTGHRAHVQGSPGQTHHVVTQLTWAESQFCILFSRGCHVIHLAQGGAAALKTWIQQGPRLQWFMTDHGDTFSALFMLALRRLLCTLLVAVTLLLLTPAAVSAQVHEHQDESGTPMIRSLESLRDLDYQSWQAVAYRVGNPGNPVVLRIVGYPGKMRLEHPASLLVQAGVKEWQLDDITLENPQLASDGREAAAEFAIDPLLNDLNNNRPLRLFLPGVFNEMPVPPYVVAEWREVQSEPLS